MLKDQIAADLEIAFSRYGFAEQSVAQLKDHCNVSLRTLYKHFPSKEAMVVGALEHRHQRYLSFLLSDAPSSGIESVLYLFNQLEQWMAQFAPHGCMSVNAVAAFPETPDVVNAVQSHKQQVRDLFSRQSGREDLADVLFVLHEGVSSAWPVMGKKSVDTAMDTVRKLMGEQQS